MKRIRIGFLAMVLMMAVCLIACQTLQQKWDKATEDEKARIIISQTQKSLKLTFLSAVEVVNANPKYKDEWKTKVLPMFEAANNILGDLIKKGQAGQKITYVEVLAAIGSRITEITDIISKWGVKTTELENSIFIAKQFERR